MSCAVLLFGMAALGLAADPALAPNQTELFTSGQDGYAAFRIPAIVATTKGTLLAFAEGRKDGTGDNGNIDVVLKRSTDRGQTWSALKIVSDMGTDAICNPCPVVDRTNGRIWLPLIW